MRWETDSVPASGAPAQQANGGLAPDGKAGGLDPGRPTRVRARARLAGDGEAAEHSLRNFLGSPPDEQIAYLDQLSAADLQTWNRLIARRADWGNQRRVEIANAILRSASRRLLERAERLLPVLEPNVLTNHVIRTDSTPSWKSTARLSLYGPSRAPDVVIDINAGTARNCDFHAALAAVALASPEHITQHIRENVNGTFDVALFRDDGAQISVTVTDRVPWSAGGYLNARPGDPASKWAMMYEKAYAQLSGGYARIEGREDRSSFRELTGNAVTERSTDCMGLTDLADQLDGGQAMIATTWLFPAWVRNVEVLSMHVYAIKSIDARMSPPSVTVLNPEGRSSFAAPTMRLTESEWLRCFATVRSVAVGRP
jgi:hypothetical protein